MTGEVNNGWYLIKNIDTIDSPTLVIYKERVSQNIDTLISMIDDKRRLRPHVKTYKSIEATKLLMNAGINKFKCATIAEAEMLGMNGAPDVLLAYQLTGPKLTRFIELIYKYPAVKFSCLVDNIASAKHLAFVAVENHISIPVYIDLNVGMNRTGIPPGDKAVDLYRQCEDTDGITVAGLHAYDGHIHSTDILKRTTECDKAFEPVFEMQRILIEEGFTNPVIVAGGSPTFPVHAKRKNIECSPGTFIYWDEGYRRSYTEQHFVPAALIITRIISLPSEKKICLDVGHKSIAAENDLYNRITFLNAAGLKFISQSEEHLIVEAAAGHGYKIGDVLYGLPVHICPTVALYERAVVIENNHAAGEWKIIARDRKINV